MTDYTELIRSLRNCSNNRCAPCDCGWFNKYQVDESCKEIIMWKAADAIEALQAELEKKRTADCFGCKCEKLEPKRGEWNNHEVACLLAEMFGNDCACNLNGIDEWLPQYCEFAETCCPNPVGVACWEQFLKHRSKMEAQDGKNET